MNAGALVWVRNLESNDTELDDLWIPTTVINKTEVASLNLVSIKVLVNGKEILMRLERGKSENDKIKSRSGLVSALSEDILDLQYLNEPEIVHFLQLRYESGMFFTLAGSVLLLVNPFTSLDISSDSTELLLNLLQNSLNTAELLVHQNEENSDSHSVATAESGSMTNQSILVGGEGGSGKSEVSRLVLRCLTQLTSGNDTLDRIIVANRILDSFGNARTVNCPDSSRFGKVVEIQFASSVFNVDHDELRVPKVVTARLKTFLLESSRTTTQQLRDRNFNVFYEVLAGISSSDRERFGLKTAADYFYANQGGLFEQQARDASQYRQLVTGLGRFGLAEAQPRIVGVLAGILNLGNVSISASDDPGTATINAALYAAAQGLGISNEALEKLLTTKTLLTPRKENITLKLSPAQSLVARDAVAKSVYKRLFEWLTTELNDWFSRNYRGRLFSEDVASFSLKLVDLFGFDSFEKNTLDQLCINFANETLQQHFIHRIFDVEMAMYEAEGIQFERLDFADNKENLAFIGTQLFPLIDDHCRLPGPSDKKLVSLMYSNFATPITPTMPIIQSNSIFSANRKQQQELKFSIKHFVGQVEYVATDFVEKNLENVPAETAATLRASTNQIVAGMFPAVTPAAATLRSAVSSVVSTFRSELTALMKEIEPTVPHFIRCIKPFQPFQTSADSWENIFKSLHGRAFQQRRVAEELKFAGVIDAVRIAKSGYRSELRYLEFYNRYRSLANEVDEEYRDPLSSLPRSLPFSTVFEAQRVFCEELVKVLSFHDELSSPAKRSGQTLSKKSSIRLNRNLSFGAVDTNEMSARSGIVAMENIQFGNSRIFMRKKEFDFLEAFLIRTRTKYASTIQRSFRMRRDRKRFLLLKQKVILLQKIFRGQFVRRRIHHTTRLERSVLRIQRQWRKKSFLRGIIMIQTVFRARRARKAVAIAKVDRDYLIQFFGQYFTAREMRSRRRGVHLTNSRIPVSQVISPAERMTLPAADLHDIQASFNHEALDLAAKQLFSNPKWALRERLKKESEHGDKNNIDNLQKRAVELVQQMPASKLKQKLEKYSKLLVHGEFLLKPEAVLEFSFIGRLLGTSSLLTSSSSLNISKKAAANVSIQPSHELFAYITKVKNKLRTIETVAAEEKARSEMDYEIKGAGDQRSMSELIEELLEICQQGKLYFDRFVRDFCVEYGDGSSYARSFSSHAEYLKALVKMILQDKSASKESLVARDAVRLLAEQEAAGDSFPLTATWHNRFEAEEKEHHELFGGLQDPLLLSKLNVVVVGKAALNKENLRVIDIQDISYQYQPIRPGQQFMVNSLIALLSGGFAPTKSLIKIVDRQPDGEVKHAIYETSHSRAADRTFLDVFYNPLAVEQVSSRSFSAMVLACVVLGLTHLQPNHITIRWESSSSASTAQVPSFLSSTPFFGQATAVELTGINGDRETMIKLFDFENSFNYRPSERNFSALFCLPQMDEPIDAVLREFLLANEQATEALLCSWLREVRAQNLRYEQLRRRKDDSNMLPFADEDMNSLLLPVKVPKGMLVEVRRRMNIVRNAMKVAEDVRIARGITFYGQISTAAADRGERSRLGSLRNSDILHIFYPELAKYYEHRRRGDEFTEGVLSAGALGIQSFAFVYHKALSDLQQGKPWDVNDGGSGVSERPASMFSRRPSSLPVSQTMNRQQSFFTQAQQSMFRTNSYLSTTIGGGNNNDSFWQKIEILPDPSNNISFLRRSKSGIPNAASASVDFADTYADNRADDAILLGGTSLFAIDENSNAEEDEPVLDHHDLYSSSKKNNESSSKFVDTNPRGKSANRVLRRLSSNALQQQTNTLTTNVVRKDDDSIFAQDSPLKLRGNNETKNKDNPDSEARRKELVRRSSSIDRLQSTRNEFMRTVSPLDQQQRLRRNDSSAGMQSQSRMSFRTPEQLHRGRDALQEGEEEEEKYDTISSLDRNITHDSFYDIPSDKQPTSSGVSSRSKSFLVTTPIRSPTDSNNTFSSRTSRLPSPSPTSGPPSLVRRNSSAMMNLNATRPSSPAGQQQQEQRFSSPTGRLAQVLVDVEEEALSFLRNIDFQSMDFNSLKHKNPDIDYFDILGTSLAFLQCWILRNVNEKQLLHITKYWLRFLKPLANVRGILSFGSNPLAARLRFCVKDLQLHYDRAEDMQMIASKPVLALLEQRMNVQIRFFFPERVSLSSPLPNLSRYGSRGSSSFFSQSQSNVERVELRVQDYKIPNQLQDLDLTQTALLPIAADIVDLPPADEELRQRLMETLKTCANLLHGQTIAEARPKVQLVKLIIEAVCLQHENHHSDHDRMHPRHRYHPLRLEADLVRAFAVLLLTYPSLVPIGEVAAERGLFTSISTDLTNDAVIHPLRPRFVKLLTILLANQPELLYMRDSKRRYLPCDALRVQPHIAVGIKDPLHPQKQNFHGMISPSVYVACGLELLTLFVNTAAQMLPRRLFEQCRSVARQQRSLFADSTISSISITTPDHPSLHYGRPDIKRHHHHHHMGIFSTYQGEEELIVCAAHFLFPVTVSELQQRRFDFFKRDAGSGQRLLLAQLVLVDAGGPVDQYLDFVYDDEDIEEDESDNEGERSRKLILGDEWLGLANLLSTADRQSLRPLIKHTLGLLINALQQRVATGELSMEDAEFFLTGPCFAGVDEEQIRRSQIAQQVLREWAVGNHISRVETAVSTANQLPRLVDSKAYELDPKRFAKYYPASDTSSPRKVSSDDLAFASVEAMAAEWAKRLAELQQLQLVVGGSSAEKKKKKGKKGDKDGDSGKKKKKSKMVDVTAATEGRGEKQKLSASAFFSPPVDLDESAAEAEKEKPKKTKKTVNYNLGASMDTTAMNEGKSGGEEETKEKKKKKRRASGEGGGKSSKKSGKKKGRREDGDDNNGGNDNDFRL